MIHPHLAARDEASLPIWLATAESWPGIAEGLPTHARAFAAAQKFEAKSGSHCLLPDPAGGILGAVFGLDGAGAKRADPFLPGKLATLLPEGAYRFETAPADPTWPPSPGCLGAMPSRATRPSR
jgi:leucyl aminopeptidase